jgi:glycosyltransferase involved in cell wall biosynthesis
MGTMGSFPFRTMFVHGAPAPHPLHGALARSVDAYFVRVDRLLSCEGRTSRAWRYASWLANAVLLPRWREVDLFLTEGPQIPPLILRQLRLLRPRQRIAALMANETLYFMRTERYEERTRRLLEATLRRFDGLVCIGQMQTDLARELLRGGQSRPRIVQCRSALDAGAHARLAEVRPALESRQVVFVGHGPDGWRGWYKGIDLLLATASILESRGIELDLRIVGRWDDSYYRSALQAVTPPAKNVLVSGPVADPAEAFVNATLYLHLGRGDAWPVTVLEAMCAGVPPLVSEWTGTKEAVAQVDDRLVVPLDPVVAADRVAWYLSLPVAARKAMSDRAREVGRQFTEARAFDVFQAALREVMEG